MKKYTIPTGALVAAFTLAAGAGAIPVSAQEAEPAPNQVGQLIQAEDFANESNPDSVEEVTILDSNDGGQKVGYLTNGSWIEFPDFDFGEDGGESVTLRYSRATAGSGCVLITVAAPDGPLLATFGLPSTGGWNNFDTISFASVLESELFGSVDGVRDLYIQFVDTQNPYVAEIDSFIINADPLHAPGLDHQVLWLG